MDWVQQTGRVYVVADLSVCLPVSLSSCLVGGGRARSALALGLSTGPEEARIPRRSSGALMLAGLLRLVQVVAAIGRWPASFPCRGAPIVGRAGVAVGVGALGGCFRLVRPLTCCGALDCRAVGRVCGAPSGEARCCACGGLAQLPRVSAWLRLFRNAGRGGLLAGVKCYSDARGSGMVFGRPSGLPRQL